jgi:hypothetical protein
MGLTMGAGRSLARLVLTPLLSFLVAVKFFLCFQGCVAVDDFAVFYVACKMVQ